MVGKSRLALPEKKDWSKLSSQDIETMLEAGGLGELPPLDDPVISCCGREIVNYPYQESQDPCFLIEKEETARQRAQYI